MDARVKNLDDTFKELWLNTEKLPALLQEWQLSVSEYISSTDLDHTSRNLLEKRAIHWQKVIAENKHILEEHQSMLRKSLKIGVECPKKLKQSMNYRS